MAHPLEMCTCCQAVPRRNGHPNTQYCEPCRQRLLRSPRSRVTPDQAAQIARLAGTIPRRAIAQQVGVAQAQVHRSLREQGLRSNARDYPPEVVAAVCTTYAMLGKVRTQELFPEVNIRSITERYSTGHYPPRQVRWTGAQLVEAARMAGLVSHTAQARWFGRPNAYAGSIAKLWTRVLRCAPRDVHGFGAHLAWQLCTPGVPALLVGHQVMPGPRTVVLWLDMVGHLRADVAPEIREVIATLAQFQAWMHGTDDSDLIRTMIQERENDYGHTSRVRQRGQDGCEDRRNL